ncbi:MAG TPA: aminotransferase class I/II-fold pyridoxal phosphate-dependent enzyme [Steroidobacteraceae bacterium]|nr:aminotransferase class I/II-fold pyridoxal phosphate-dependent enzyme [Steroidobacteraceae bacterium]
MNSGSSIFSKLPDVGTTIFTVMSRRAVEQGAVNVGQGFPDYPIDSSLAACVADAVAAGFNQYAPMEGSIALRAAIAAKIVAAGGRCIHIPLEPPHFRYDWDRVRASLSARTRLIIINNPHNPACTVASAADLDTLAALTRDRPIGVLADEVYEHVQYDGRVHQSVMNHAELRERSFAVYSFGKTLHITGWRVGYCVAPAAMTRELRKVHQFNTFSIAAPLQEGIRRYLERHPDAWRGVAAFFSAKRDLLRERLAGSGLVMPPAQGSYFQLADYASLGGDLAACNDVEFTERLINEAGVAVIPLSPFYREPPADMRVVRLCVAKRDETLVEAARRIREYTAGRKRGAIEA